MEFTQEQIDKMVADKVAEATQGLYTKSDLDREVDRRVESGIQKGVETQKSKWQEEFERKASLTAEERVKEQMAQMQTEIADREKALALKANTLDAKELLVDAGVKKEDLDKALQMTVSDNGEATKQNVTQFIEMFNGMKTDLETKIKAELSHVPAPEVGQGEVMTADKFKKLGYQAQMDFKAENPKQYKQFMTE